MRKWMVIYALGLLLVVLSASTGMAQTVISTENFDTWPPAGWTIVDNAGNGIIWKDNNYWSCDNYTEGANTCAMVDSSDSNIYYDTELRTPAYDFSGYGTVALNFKANYQDDYKDWSSFIDQRDRFEVDVSTDGGSTWQTVLNWEVQYHQSHGAYYNTPGADVQINLTDEAAGESNVIIRFHYYTSAPGDAQDKYVQVDNMFISSGFVAGPVTVGPSGDYSTIQEALSAIAPGGTINVADGTYVENIFWPLGKDGIVLQSINGPTNCTIDGDDNGFSTVTMDAGGNDPITTATQLIGFTIQNGSDEHGGGINMAYGVSASIIGNEVGYNDSYRSGGGICGFRNTSPLIQGNKIYENRSQNNSGGGIHCPQESTPTITGNEIYDNSSNRSGGGIQCGMYSSPTISGNAIWDNTAHQSGGGIGCGEYSSPTINGNNEIYENYSYDSGGGINCGRYSRPVIDGNNIYSNQTNDCANGGGINAGQDSEPIIINNTIRYNSTPGNGGGIHCSYVSDPTIEDNTVEYNHAGNNGGGIAIGYEQNITFSGNTISGNSADNQGGGLHVGEYSDVTILGCDIDDNDSDHHGGGVHIGYDSVLIIENSTISDNICNQHGGGVHVGQNSEVSIDSCTINDNENGQHGGGIHVGDESDLTIENSTISGNYSWQHGGGIHIGYSSEISITGCTISENFAYQNGGGFKTGYNSEVVMTSNIITDNAARSHGGGIELGGDSDSVISENLISGNYVYGEGASYVYGGGGIFVVDDGSPIIKFNTIADNSAPLGGGIFCCFGSHPDILNNTMIGNWAWGMSSPPPPGFDLPEMDIPEGYVEDLEDDSLCLGDSFAPEDGGSFYPDGPGGGIFCIGYGGYGGYDSYPDIRNNIIVDTVDGFGIYVDGGARPTIQYNDVWNNTPDNYGGYVNDVVPTGMDPAPEVIYPTVNIDDTNISVDPEFWDADNEDYHLAFASPCIDTGDPSSIYNDPYEMFSIDGLRSNIGRFRIPCFSPEVPTNLVVDNAGLNGLQITWDDNSDYEDGFKIERRITIYGSWTEIADLGANVTYYLDEDLPQEDIYYRVYSYNNCGGASEYSDVVSGVVYYTLMPGEYVGSDYPPIVFPGEDQTVCIGATVSLDGSDSWDFNADDVLTYEWMIVSSPTGSTASLTSTDTPETSFVPVVPGTYVIQLAVNDGGNVSSATVTITVEDCSDSSTGQISDDISGSSGGGCFVATAAYGSKDAPVVKSYILLRDKYLLNTAWGRTFVSLYYTYSPSVADVIANHTMLRAAVRVLLTPSALLLFAGVLIGGTAMARSRRI